MVHHESFCLKMQRLLHKSHSVRCLNNKLRHRNPPMIEKVNFPDIAELFTMTFTFHVDDGLSTFNQVTWLIKKCHGKLKLLLASCMCDEAISL